MLRTVRVVLVGLVVAMLGSCAQFGGGSGRDPAEFFPEDDARALAAAVLSEDAGLIANLVGGSTSPNAQGDGGLTMLQWAVWNDKPQAVSALLEAGADPNQIGEGGNSALHTAAFSGNTEHLVTLLAAGGDPDIQGEVTGSTPLDTAMLNSNEEPVRILLEAGANPDVLDKNRDGPMHTAARTNKGWAILLMLQHGADPAGQNLRDRSWQDFYWGYNPDLLNDRARDERRALIEWLDEHGYDVHPGADQFRAGR